MIFITTIHSVCLHYNVYMSCLLSALWEISLSLHMHLFICTDFSEQRSLNVCVYRKRSTEEEIKKKRKKRIRTERANSHFLLSVAVEERDLPEDLTAGIIELAQMSLGEVWRMERLVDVEIIQKDRGGLCQGHVNRHR